MYKTRSFQLYFYTCVLIAFCSCNLINPPEKVPAFIQIDHIDFSVITGQGSSSSKFTDAWVYVDDQPIGCYELPAKFPVLQEGNHKIAIYPGIKVNGISGTRGVYPFVEPWITNVNLKPDSTTVLIPSTTYYSSTKFAFIEEFEDGGLLFEKALYSDTMIIQTNVPSEVFEGTYSGIITLDNVIDTFECKTISAYVLPKSNSPVFVELNYKSNNPFTIGVYSNYSSYSVKTDYLTVNASSSWNKIYINLTSLISRESTASDSKIYFSANTGNNVSNGVILLDNIKLLHW